MPGSPDVVKIATMHLYSHAPAQAAFDVSDQQLGGRAYCFTVPYDRSPDDGDPLSSFLSQSAHGVDETEAQRIGADRFGMTWPMIRAQRLHSGDSHVTQSIMRRIYAHSRLGQIFTPLEMPQNPQETVKRLPPPSRVVFGQKMQ